MKHTFVFICLMVIFRVFAQEEEGHDHDHEHHDEHNSNLHECAVC